jgi:hypothetical protein
LQAGSHITAIDRENQSLDVNGVDFMRADFVKNALQLEELDSILIANALHYVLDKRSLIQQLERMFGGNPCFIIIEYDSERSNPWVPYPITFEKLELLFQLLNCQSVVKVNERWSLMAEG